MVHGRYGEVMLNMGKTVANRSNRNRTEGEE